MYYPCTGLQGNKSPDYCNNVPRIPSCLVASRRPPPLYRAEVKLGSEDLSPTLSWNQNERPLDNCLVIAFTDRLDRNPGNPSKVSVAFPIRQKP